mmetsp:Transcript_73213/g.129657  ORF Transcript_73213/g.129657 Transcript_73213/m.129657 type:complete len:329 (+) Transcript_73213:81-1067(+)
MRVIPIVLTCLACMGHGRRVLNASAGLSGGTHQAGLSRRSGAPDPKDSFASLLDMRGGMGGLDDGNVWRSLGDTESFRDRNTRRAGRDDVRGGYVESLPMMPYRSRGALRARRSALEFEDLLARRAALEFEDLDDYDLSGEGANVGMRQAADMEGVYGTRSLRSMYGSASQVRPSIARHGDTEDFGDWNMRRPWSEEFDDVRGVYVEPLPMTPSRSRGWLHSPRAAVEFEDLDDFRGQGANIGMRQAADAGIPLHRIADVEAVYETPRPRPGLLGRVRQTIARVSDTEDFRDSDVRMKLSTPGGRVEFADLQWLRSRQVYDDIEAHRL